MYDDIRKTAGGVAMLSSPSLKSLYEQDYNQWVQEIVRLLKERNFEELDLPNLIDEVEDLSGSQRRELKNRLRVLLMHLLKWEYQPQKWSASWIGTIVEQRRQIESILEVSPSLIAYLSEMFGQGQVYVKARKDAAKETKLPLEAFPSECPWLIEQVLDEDYLPPEDSPEVL
jgi:hypothetical protein